MDIQLASNFERYLYYLLDEDPAAVRQTLAELERTRRIVLDEPRLRVRVAADFDARAVSDEETLAQIRATHAETGYFLCPHTAVGVRAARDLPEAICLATAHPAKFNEAVRAAVGTEAPPPACLRDLFARETRAITLPATPEAVRAYLSAHLSTA